MNLTRAQMTQGMLPFAVFSIAALVTLGIRQVALRLAGRKAMNPAGFGYVFLDAVRLPSVLWSIAIAIAIAIHSSTLTSTQLYWAQKGIGAFVILSISLAIASGAVRMVAVYGARNGIPFAVAGLSRTLTYILVLSIGGLMLLRLFDITITPLLTALGVGGLAVALALQDTLANLFAGIHILVEQPVMVGDFMRLSSGEEGVVQDIGWRTTRILTGGNNIIVVPNTKITSGILTNFSLPEKRIVLDIPILVALESDPNLVAQIAMEVAIAAKGVLADPPPTVSFDPGVTPTHMQLKLSVHVPAQAGRGAIASAIRLSIFEKLRAAGVPLPSAEKIVVIRQ